MNLSLVSAYYTNTEFNHELLTLIFYSRNLFYIRLTITLQISFISCLKARQQGRNTRKSEKEREGGGGRGKERREIERER